jgi:hypothetical protein
MTKFIFFLFFLPIIGCVNKDSVPSDIIGKDSMKLILWDMIQADQYSKQYLAKDSAKINVHLETMKLYQQVFDIHHTNKDEFKKSYQFYLSKPNLSSEVFDSLAAYANRQRTEIYKPKPVDNKPKPVENNKPKPAVKKPVK